MKKFVYLLLLAPGLLSGEALAQLSVGSSATLYVGSGATLSVNGTLQNAGTLTNAGHVFLRGHLQNTAALASAEGDLTLDGSAAQTLAVGAFGAEPDAQQPGFRRGRHPGHAPDGGWGGHLH